MSERVSKNENQGTEAIDERGKIKTFFSRLISITLSPFKVILSAKNRGTVFVLAMVVSTLGGVGWILYDSWREKNSQPVGCVDQNAMMAVGGLEKDEPFLVYVSERRRLEDLSADFYSLFPGYPVDSMAVVFSPDREREVGFSSAVFCLDWFDLDPNVRKKLVEIQRGRSKDPSFLFGQNPVGLSPDEKIDDVPVFKATFSSREMLFVSFGNALLLSSDRDSMIGSLKALIHAMTRLSWDEGGGGRIVRSFVEGDRRYRLYLYSSSKDLYSVLPRRTHQSLSVDLLLDMAMGQVASSSSSDEILSWLIRKDGAGVDDITFATDPILYPSLSRDYFVLRGDS
ncbi:MULTISPECIES: hypothetical protein [Dethiosulfovibrio]|uniref:DUF3352 domain-containing protein n=2 Tax=Dethiosulfovibrio TaxID=47054 RepID=A0ABS9EPY0_9BACT|nr:MULTISPECIES: hypothetical protein [Dethiosulfovibrio]MCF4113403.1 hypothetical protein [Dethiosulfovibrio russensis]MCF4141873.1 hypothetical protein [Dethiosulfovibrio marinus]MCF4144027.1 hypothetical protein [Dethiosulfovibrio acidaminovorans]